MKRPEVTHFSIIARVGKYDGEFYTRAMDEDGWVRWTQAGERVEPEIEERLEREFINWMLEDLRLAVAKSEIAE